jgi:hypothetical protein
MRFLAWTSWLSLGVATLAAAAMLFCVWGVNAGPLGAKDAGLALSFSFAAAIIGVASLYAAPVLALAGISTLFVQRRAGLVFIGAAAACALPLAILTFMER